MASTDITQRNLYERIDLSTPTTGVTVKRPGRVIALTAFLLCLLGVLVYAAAEGVNEWAQVVVLGGIVMTAIGAVIALNPARPG